MTAPTKYALKFKPRSRNYHNPPVQNQWYELANLTGGLHLRSLEWIQNNDEAASKDVEWEITIDGEVFSGTETLSNGVSRFFKWATGNNLITQALGSGFGTMIDNATTMFAGSTLCHSFYMRYRMISAPGTNQNLEVILAHDALEAV